MARRKRGIAIIVLRCAIVGFGASAQQMARGTEMVISSMPAVEIIQEAVGSNVSPRSLGMRLAESNDAPPTPVVLAQTDPVAPVSQAASSNSLGVQETKNANVPAEPQAVMREIKSAARLSSSKQRRRKPKMAGVPTGLQAVAQETKEPGAQAVVVQEKEEAGTPEETLAATQETKKTLVYPTSKAEVAGVGVKKAGKKYGMAPILWGVSIIETASYERLSQTYHGVAGINSNSKSSSIGNTLTVDVKAKTYIMQPYLAQLSGNVGLLNTVANGKRNSPNAINGSQSNINNNSSNTRFFGDGLLQMFSQSRFPFTMGLGVAAERDKYENTPQDLADKYLFLRQTYQPLSRASKYSGGYTRESTTSSTSGDAKLNGTVNHTVWNGSYSLRTLENSVFANINYKDKIISSIDNSTKRTDNFSVNHTYMPYDSLLTLESVANLNWFGNNLNLARYQARYQMASTHATWQPESEDIPLFVDGNVYLLNQWNTNQEVNLPVEVTKTQSVGGNVGATYLYSKNVSGRADASATRTKDVNGRILTIHQQGTIQYTSDSTQFWKTSSYSWHANGGANNNKSIDHPQTQLTQLGRRANSAVFGGVGHNLSVPYLFNMFGKKWSLRSNINQDLSAQRSIGVGQTATLLNSAYMKLGPSVFGGSDNLMGGYGKTSGLNTGASLKVTDTRVFGKNPSHKRSYGLTLFEASRTTYSREGLTFEVMLGADQGISGKSSRTGSGTTSGTSIFGSGIATYTKSRVFEVKGLDYKGSLKTSRQFQGPATAGSDANNPRFPWVLDQKLTYKLGQNEVALSSIIADQNGVKSASLWLLFRAWRAIGSY